MSFLSEANNVSVPTAGDRAQKSDNFLSDCNRNLAQKPFVGEWLIAVREKVRQMYWVKMCFDEDE